MTHDPMTPNPTDQDVAALAARLLERWESTDAPVAKKVNRLLAVCREAATALSTLAAERDAARADARDHDRAEIGWASEREDRLALEAQLARAREALESEREVCAKVAADVIDKMRGSGESDLRSAKARVEQAIRARSIPAPCGWAGEVEVNFGPSEHGQALKAKRNAERALASKDLPSEARADGVGVSAEEIVRALHEHFGASSTTLFTAREAGRQAGVVALRALTAPERSATQTGERDDG